MWPLPTDISSSPINVPHDGDPCGHSHYKNIRAQRLVQSIKRTKKANGGALFWEGWMIHTTNIDLSTEKKYYWRVDASYVTIIEQYFLSFSLPLFY